MTAIQVIAKKHLSGCFHYAGMNCDTRDMSAFSPHYERTAEFVEPYDNPALNPKTETFLLSMFEPIVHMAAPKNSAYKAAIEPQGA